MTTADNKKTNARFASEFLAKTEEKVNLHFQPVFLLPGDSTGTISEGVRLQKTGKTDKILLGWGLSPDNESKEQSNPEDTRSVSARVVCAGVLQYRPTTDGGFYWVRHCGRKKYFPSFVSSRNEVAGSAYGDQVVGIIEERGGDYYMVNVFSSTHCVLNRLAFEGATKRNKPELKRGDVVYARVTSSTEGGDLEISCIYPGAIKKDWTTGETVYGELPQGLVIRVPIEYAKSLLHPDCIVLNALGSHFAFETAIGVNGVVWLRAGSAVEAIVIRNALLNAELLSRQQTVAMVDQLAKAAKKAVTSESTSKKS